MINDLAVTRKGAWFTDSVHAKLSSCRYRRPECSARTARRSSAGPAADTSDEFTFNNGIQATLDGKTLIVAHDGRGVLNTVEPITGASAVGLRQRVRASGKVAGAGGPRPRST